MFYQVVIPYKGQVKDLKYTIKCEFLHFEKKKQTKSICCDCLTDTTPANSVLAFRSINRTNFLLYMLSYFMVKKS